MKTSEYTMENTLTGAALRFIAGTDKISLAQKLAVDVAELLKKGIATRGKASIVVSGGSTPKPFFEALRRQRGIEWDKVYITLADDRWVDAPHPDSNEQLVKDHLLVKDVHFISLKTKDVMPHQAIEKVQARISALPRPFDVVILGMGDDGHTASFFPGAPELQDALYPAEAGSLVAAITPPAYAPHLRMTLTLPAILNAERIIIHITSDKKRNVYNEALNDNQIETMPVRAVLRQSQTPVDVYWAE